MLPIAFSSCCRPLSDSAVGGATHCGTASNASTAAWSRSEEHTSELQSHSDLVCRLLLEKKIEQRGRSIEITPEGLAIAGTPEPRTAAEMRQLKRRALSAAATAMFDALTNRSPLSRVQLS